MIEESEKRTDKGSVETPSEIYLLTKMKILILPGWLFLAE